MKERPKISGADVVVRNADLLTTEVDGEVIALSIENGACYGLNRVGSRIWAMIADPRSVDDICAGLLREFEVEPDTCRREVVDLLETLRGDGLVTVEAG